MAGEHEALTTLGGFGEWPLAGDWAAWREQRTDGGGQRMMRGQKTKDEGQRMGDDPLSSVFCPPS